MAIKTLRSSAHFTCKRGEMVPRTVRWPLLVLTIASAGIGSATALDRTTARGWALAVGGLALTALLQPGWYGWPRRHQLPRRQPLGPPIVPFAAT